MVIKDYICSCRKKKKIAFYKFIAEKVNIERHGVYYRFFRGEEFIKAADRLLFEMLIKEFEKEYADNE